MLNILASLLLFVVVVKFFKSLMGTDANRERMEETVKRHRMRSRDRATKAQTTAEDMTQCAVCEAYLPKSAPSNCGRSDCPH